jgi:hypothetical protein
VLVSVYYFHKLFAVSGGMFLWSKTPGSESPPSKAVIAGAVVTLAITSSLWFLPLVIYTHIHIPFLSLGLALRALTPSRGRIQLGAGTTVQHQLNDCSFCTPTSDSLG